MDTAITELTGERATDLVCHLGDVLQLAGRQALGQVGAVVQHDGCQQGREDEKMVWSELDHASVHRSVNEINTNSFFNIFSRQDSQPELLPLLLDSLLVVIWNLHHSVVSD